MTDPLYRSWYAGISRSFRGASQTAPMPQREICAGQSIPGNAARLLCPLPAALGQSRARQRGRGMPFWCEGRCNGDWTCHSAFSHRANMRSMPIRGMHPSFSRHLSRAWAETVFPCSSASQFVRASMPSRHYFGPVCRASATASPDEDPDRAASDLPGQWCGIDACSGRPRRRRSNSAERNLWAQGTVVRHGYAYAGGFGLIRRGASSDGARCKRLE